jgi:hypothetical protein
MFGIDCGADPLVRTRPPGRPLRDRMGLIWPGEERDQGDPRGPVAGPEGSAPPANDRRGSRYLLYSMIRYKSRFQD